ncbi:general substrate transporter [Crepidotus variabilis]|uniref:General substrate transporter n=1 Tax=Crepidotus variabilis TaxID=179855 RepID=A0A9P6JUE2_9AGAR|nr:general substrate transporter [Crepidotus variabilis]
MSNSTNGSTFTTYGWAVCLWGLINSFQYGYHISVLNQIQAVLTCEDQRTNPGLAPSFLNPSTCIEMSGFVFSFVTAVFTIGGLTGSLVANLVMDSKGRRGTHRICAFFVVTGNVFMGFGSSIFSLSLGRFLIGVASGLGLCVTPIYLAEIAPSSISGSVGVLAQMSIVIGIMVTQSIGLNLATPETWRYVFLVSFAISAVQLVAAPAIVESPSFLLTQSRQEDQKNAARRLWGGTYLPLSDEEPESEEPRTPNTTQRGTITVPEVFRRPELRGPLLVVCFAMLSQQLSGINAVLYYSNSILSKALPDFGPYVSLGITIVNTIMTFPPIFLIEKLGRKPILLLSALGSIVSLILLGYGLDSNASKLASVTIVTFVMSFAFGLGPIPFVMIPEVSPPYAVSALSSIALSLNWIANFSVGLAFLPIQNLLSGGDQLKEGRVFYLFVTLFGICVVTLFRLYRT